MRRNLDDELKLLQWHKVANESALRAALIRTKCSRENDKRLSIELEMKARQQVKERIMRVKEEEKSKPLEVGKDFMIYYEKNQHVRNIVSKERIDRKISLLQGVANKLKQREMMRSRKKYCRDFKKKIEIEKRDDNLRQFHSNGHPKICNNDRDIYSNTTTWKKQGTAKAKHEGGSCNGLDAILNSLEQLASLEQRTKDLEENNFESSTPLQKTNNMQQCNVLGECHTTKNDNILRPMLSFSKERTVSTPGNPSRPYFTISQTAVSGEVTNDSNKASELRNPQNLGGN